MIQHKKIYLRLIFTDIRKNMSAQTVEKKEIKSTKKNKYEQII